MTQALTFVLKPWKLLDKETGQCGLALPRTSEFADSWATWAIWQGFPRALTAAE